MMQTLRGMATVSFYAEDMAAAQAWYSKLLGIDPYFVLPMQGPPAYIEFRLGDYQAELGIINNQYAPKNRVAGVGGAILYWHVDDVAEMFNTLISMGATEFEPVTARGDSGFVTASVMDPFGNVLGVMYNPHYLEILTAHENA